jgi:hypothetical protein
MASDNQQDGRLFRRLDFGYNKILRDLDEQPRLIDGLNTYITAGGSISKRPPTTLIASTTKNFRIDRLWLYETQETPAKTYIMASMYNASDGDWEIWYNRLDGGSPGWTTAGSLRDLNASTRPHEAIAARGLFYIKGFPASGSSEKLGTVIFDGSGASPSTKPWGLLGPTTPARISGVIKKIVADITSSSATVDVNSVAGFPATPFYAQIEYETVQVTGIAGVTLTISRAQLGTIAAAHTALTPIVYRDWSASANNVTVNFGWKYSYAYKSITGQVSNRAPLETNPDKMPSITGPFFDLIPKITVQGTADTTNIPSIVVFRSTDGGGNFKVLRTITNTGAGAITVLDDRLESGAAGGTFSDPIPDDVLLDNEFGTDLTSSSPPPTVNAPLITGTDTVAASSPLAYFSGRIWFGIGNILYFSSQEETPADGIPEECFPSGFKGNFFRFGSNIINLKETSQALYVITTNEVIIVQGNNRETFNGEPAISNVGAPYSHPRAITNYRESIVWLTHDYRIAVAQGEAVKFISDPLASDIVDAVNDGHEIEIEYWAELEKEWIVVNAYDKTTPANSRQWVYDIKKSIDMKMDFWNPPWDIRAVASLSGRIRENNTQRRLCYFVYDGTANSKLVYLDTTGTLGTDDYPSTASSPIDFHFTTNLFMVPEGNHINALRQPANIPTFYEIRIDRTFYDEDIDPRVQYYIDDTWTKAYDTKVERIAKLERSRGFRTLIYPIQKLAQRVAIKISKEDSRDRFELQNLYLIWTPDKGTGS